MDARRGEGGGGREKDEKFLVMVFSIYVCSRQKSYHENRHQHISWKIVLFLKESRDFTLSSHFENPDFLLVGVN